MFDLILDSVEDFHTVEDRRLHRIFGGLYIEITSGLEEGDTVLIQEQDGMGG